MKYTFEIQFNKTNTKVTSKQPITFSNNSNSYEFKTKNELIEFFSEVFYYNVNHD
jgi:hypothetical protein